MRHRAAKFGFAVNLVIILISSEDGSFIVYRALEALKRQHTYSSHLVKTMTESCASE